MNGCGKTTTEEAVPEVVKLEDVMPRVENTIDGYWLCQDYIVASFVNGNIKLACPDSEVLLDTTYTTEDERINTEYFTLFYTMEDSGNILLRLSNSEYELNRISEEEFNVQYEELSSYIYATQDIQWEE